MEDLAPSNPNTGATGGGTSASTSTATRSTRKRRRSCFSEIIAINDDDDDVLSPPAVHLYSLTAEVPLPEATWSTTAPSVVPVGGLTHTYTPPVVEEFQDQMGNQWTDSYASWWVAFLNSLDHHHHHPLDDDSSPTLTFHRDNHNDSLLVGDHESLLDDWMQLEFPILVDY